MLSVRGLELEGCYNKNMEKSQKLLYDEVPMTPDGRLYKVGDWREIPQIKHNGYEIKGFFGGYRFLSNFEAANVVLDGISYPSVEIAYQAAKWDYSDRGFFLDCTNEEAIKYNRKHCPNGYDPDYWDKFKVEVMRFLLEQKFDPYQNPKNYETLIATKDKYLEETNWWGDTFWGKNLNGEGDNNLGKLLMAIRDTYRQY